MGVPNDRAEPLRQSQVEQPRHMDDAVACVRFGRDGNSDQFVGNGWSAAENGFRWMVDDASELSLDAPALESLILTLDVHPHIGAPACPAQRVIFKIEGVEIYRTAISEPNTCVVPIPPARIEVTSSAAGKLRLTIEHPDAVSPMALTGQEDHRRLALAVREARLFRSDGRQRDALLVNEVTAPAVIAEPSRLATVFVGNCQMGALCALYRRMIPAQIDHDVRYVPSYQDATEAVRQTIAKATVVVQQVLNFVPKIGDLPTKAKVFLVPHASAAFLWPYAGNPHPLNRSEPSIERSGPYNAELGDSFLNRLIASGASPPVAVAQYLTADAATVNRAERMMELHLQKQRERDSACGIRVADRIEELLKMKRLFRSPNHPEPGMACWIAEQVFIQMGEAASDIAKLVSSLPDALPATETPLHPAIVRHFGLPDSPPSRRYRYFEEGGFTFVEYVVRYMRYKWNAQLADSLAELRQQATDQSIAALEAAVLTAPRSVIGRMTLAEALARLGRLQDALNYASQAVLIEPENDAVVRRLQQLSASLTS